MLDSPLRRALVRVALLLASFALLAVIGVTLIALLGVTLDARHWRTAVVAAVSHSLAREVRIEGAGELRLSLWPEILVREVRIANPEGFDARGFATIGELRLAVDLLPLLHREVRVREMRGRDVVLRLSRSREGTGNWIFGQALTAAAHDAADPARFTLAQLDLQRISLQNVLAQYIDQDSVVHQLELTELAGEARADRPARLTLRGVVDKEFPYDAALDAAPLAGFGAARPWKFGFKLFFLGTALNVEGTVTGPLENPRVEAAFGAGTESIRQVEQLLDIKLPPLGATAASGTLSWTPQRWTLSSLNGVMGQSSLAGDLVLETGGARAKLTGSVACPVIDMAPFFAQQPGSRDKSKQTLAATFRELANTDLNFDRLARMDAELRLSVGHWASLPGDLRDTSMVLRLEAGRLAAPLQVKIAGATFSGDLTVDSTTTPARLHTRLVAMDSPLGGLAEVLFGAPYVDGTVRRFELALDAAGESLGPLVHGLEARVALEEARLTYGNFEGGQPVRMRLEALRLANARGGAVTAKLRGSLLGKAFGGTFNAASIERILREGRSPFAFDAESAGVRARVSGVLAPARETSGSELAFQLTAQRARDVAPWLGVSSQSDARVALEAKVQRRRDETSFLGASLALGRTSMQGEMRVTTVAGRGRVKASIAAERIDADELQRLLPGAGAERRVVDIPILPRKLDLADSDLELRARHVDGLALAVTELAIEGHIRGGQMTPSPFSLRIEDIPFKGALALDLRGDVPSSDLWLASEEVDVGAVLHRLGFAPNVEATVKRLALYTKVRESRLGIMLERSSLLASIESGSLAWRDLNTGAALRVLLEGGEVRADSGQPVHASLAGSVGGAPVSLRIVGGRLLDFVDARKRMPFSVELNSAETSLWVGGGAAPNREPDLDLTLSMKGARLNALDALLGKSLPPWGPYALGAQLRVTKGGYRVDKLRMNVGQSVLDGYGSLDTTTATPQLKLQLHAESVQLDDFRFGSWSPFEEKELKPRGTKAAEVRAAAAGASKTVESLLSRELLRASDARISADVKQVLSGQDALGGGRMVVQVANGRIEVGPLEVDTPGGTASFAFAYEPRDEGTAVEAHAHLQRFDYGTLARRFSRQTEVVGKLSLDLEFAAVAPQLAEALAHGNGRIDFAVWPERLRAGAFDLWATNLLVALLPAVDPNASRVNCAIGEFDLKDGKLESRRLLIDTTHTRAEGGGKADFATERIQLRLAPQPKTPQFFSLATPVEVTGTFDKYDIHVSGADVLATVARWLSAVIVVPIQKLTMERPPADGGDVCTLRAR